VTQNEKRKTFTNVELEFMKIIWPAGEANTEMIQDTLKSNGRDLSDGAIRRVLAIMVEKGFISRRKEGQSFYYKAEIPEQKAQTNMVNDLVEKLFGGSTSSMVASLIQNRSVNAKEMQKIKKMIEKYENEKKK